MEYPQNLTVSERRWFDLIQQCRASGKNKITYFLLSRKTASKESL